MLQSNKGTMAFLGNKLVIRLEVISFSQTYQCNYRPSGQGLFVFFWTSYQIFLWGPVEYFSLVGLILKSPTMQLSWLRGVLQDAMGRVSAVTQNSRFAMN